MGEQEVNATDGPHMISEIKKCCPKWSRHSLTLASEMDAQRRTETTRETAMRGQTILDAL